MVFVSENGKTIHIQEDNAVRTDSNGACRSARAIRSRRTPSAPIQVARLTKKGWKIVKGSRILVGSRSKYHDYSF